MNWTRFSDGFSPNFNCDSYYVTFQYKHGREAERLWYSEEFGGWFDNPEYNDAPLEPDDTWIAWAPFVPVEPFQG